MQVCPPSGRARGHRSDGPHSRRNHSCSRFCWTPWQVKTYAHPIKPLGFDRDDDGAREPSASPEQPVWHTLRHRRGSDW